MKVVKVSECNKDMVYIACFERLNNPSKYEKNNGYTFGNTTEPVYFCVFHTAQNVQLY